MLFYTEICNLSTFLIEKVTLSFLLYVHILLYLLFGKFLLIFKYTFRAIPKFLNLFGKNQVLWIFFSKNKYTIPCRLTSYNNILLYKVETAQCGV